MATVLEILPEHEVGLYDSGTGQSLVTEKVVDVTEDCPSATPKNRCVLLFTRAQRGRVCQIGRPYEGKVYTGTHVHFFIDEEHPSTFSSTAHELGLNPSELQQLIELHAPA